VQNIGAVETYQRRYLWVTAMEIVEHDALDSSEPVKPAAKSAALPHTPSVAKTVLNDMPPLDEADAKYYKELAAEAEDVFTKQGAADAYDYVQAFALDNEQMIYLWASLGSKFRSAIKAEKTRRNQKETA
jgi:hypothetical protein